MKVTGLNGRTYNLNTQKYIVRKDDKKRRSKLHLRARNLLNEMFPAYSILEEMKLPGSGKAAKKSVLFLDFFVPNLNLAVEVHGQQHYQYSHFFHKTTAEFLLHQKRDEDKKRWCELNEIIIAELPYDKSDDEWRSIINSKRSA